MRYLIRVRNVGWPPSKDAVAAIRGRLSSLPLPRFENVRISSSALEFDLYTGTPGQLQGELSSVASALGDVISVRDLSTPEHSRTADESLGLATVMYSEERFWEVHEELEMQWRKFKRGEPEKGVLQGLILLAAAYVHQQKGEEDVAISVLKRAKAKLDAYTEPDYRGLDVAALKVGLQKMLAEGVVRYVELRRTA
jgi:hypothetical protein